MKISHLSVRTLVLIGASAAVISFAGPADARDHKHSCGNAKICGGPIIIGGRTGTGLRLPIQGDIKFEKVRFRYSPDAPLALDDVSFRVPRGKMIGVMGRSGVA